MNKKVSVIICTYNRSAYLRECIASLLSQTVLPVEILVVDDASTDDTVEVLSEIAGSSRLVRHVSLPENAGPSAARNIGIQQSLGDYIAIMDSDDVSTPNRIQHQLDFMEKTGCGLCGSWFLEFGKGFSRVVKWPSTKEELKAAMLFQNTILHPSMMVRRDVFKNHLYKEDMRLAEDYDFCVRVMSTFHAENIPEVLLKYRRHGGQATLSKRMEMESVTRGIRMTALKGQGIEFNSEQLRLHNMIRAPLSITDKDDLAGIEDWIISLLAYYDTHEARSVIAEQWLRACIRAAPLGRVMFRKYRSSPLYELFPKSRRNYFDMLLLSIAKMPYDSKAFSMFSKFG